MTLPQMTPDEKRIAVAEFEGWCNCFIAGGDRDYKAGEIYGYYLNKDYCIALPDYLNDLNAIVKACGKLDADQRGDFAIRLSKIVKADSGWIHRDGWLIAQATASQRVDALLLTIGKATL